MAKARGHECEFDPSAISEYFPLEGVISGIGELLARVLPHSMPAEVSAFAPQPFILGAINNPIPGSFVVAKAGEPNVVADLLEGRCPREGREREEIGGEGERRIGEGQ